MAVIQRKKCKTARKALPYAPLIDQPCKRYCDKPQPR